MEITLRRHAQTQGNLARHYLGRTDEALCPEGLAYAESLPRDETVPKVYTSQLRRTVQTAGILYPRADIVPVPGLAEMDFGAFEGKSYGQLKDDAAYRAWLDSGQTLPCPDGEDKENFIARCCQSFAAVLESELAAGSQKLVLVVHGGTIMALLSRLARPEQDYFSWHAPFCGGYRLALRPSPLRGQSPGTLAESRPLLLVQALGEDVPKGKKAASQ